MWEPVHYEDRAPRHGKRADRHHALKLFPNYSQFGAPRFSDTIGRQYRVADGIDRYSAQEHGLVAKGPPEQVEPTLFYERDEDDEPTIVFPHSGLPLAGRMGRGGQMLYVRLPRGSADLGLPRVGETLRFLHDATGALATGKVTHVDGYQFPRVSTASVIVKDLVFLNPK